MRKLIPGGKFSAAVPRDNLVLTTELKHKLATVKSKKADVSPSSERLRCL